MMKLWITAASALQYAEDVGQIVAETLRQVVDDYDLRRYIPVLAWDWLKKRSSPRGVWLIMLSRFTVWSEQHHISPGEDRALLPLIREELSGSEAREYRADLIQRLDYILSRLESGSDRKSQYEELRTGLLEMDEEAKMALTCMSQSCPLFVY